MFKYEYEDNGFIISATEIGDEEFETIKAFVKKQNDFLNENEITWVYGTLLKGEGNCYANWEDFASLKDVKSIDKMYFTGSQYEDITSKDNPIKEWIENGKDCSAFITELIQTAGKLFMVNYKTIKILGEKPTSIKPVTKVTAEKPVEQSKIVEKVSVGKVTSKPKNTKLPKPKSKTISLADVFRLKKHGNH